MTGLTPSTLARACRISPKLVGCEFYSYEWMVGFMIAGCFFILKPYLAYWNDWKDSPFPHGAALRLRLEKQSDLKHLNFGAKLSVSEDT